MTERELGLLLAKLEALHEDVLELKAITNELHKRVSVLEKFKAWSVGVGAVLMTLATIALRFLTFKGF